MFVPVNVPLISEEAKKNVQQALDTGWISSSGPMVQEFEERFQQRWGVKHAITVSSGTAALHVSLLALGIGSGDEVIVPAFTMAASWLAVLYTGAKPVFVDCELDTYNIDPQKIKNKITEKTRAIMPVHIYGHPADMDPIMQIAGEHNLKVIEDAAEAHGAMYKGRWIGTFGDINCFSFYGNKIVTTGEGGMVVTDNDEYAGRVRKFKDLHHSEKRFIHDGVGFNYRLTNVQAAIGVGELAHLDEYVEKKQWMAKMYNELFLGIPGVILPTTRDDVLNVFWMYTIRIDEQTFGLGRDELRIQLKEVGVDTRDFFYAPHAQPVLKDLVDGETFPNTKLISRTGLYVPSGLAITEEEIKYVAAQLKIIHEKNR